MEPSGQRGRRRHLYFSAWRAFEYTAAACWGRQDASTARFMRLTANVSPMKPREQKAKTGYELRRTFMNNQAVMALARRSSPSCWGFDFLRPTYDFRRLVRRIPAA